MITKYVAAAGLSLLVAISGIIVQPAVQSSQQELLAAQWVFYVSTNGSGCKDTCCSGPSLCCDVPADCHET